VAVLAVLLLRGPQSARELMTRTERYAMENGAGFESVDEVERALAELAGRDDPLVTNIGRGSGQSQDRWAHLLGEGVPDVNATGASAHTAARDRSPSLAQRVDDLEARLAALETALGVSVTVPSRPQAPNEPG
jgi:uncharacterized protein YceH (UPF0502 family)